MVNNCVERWWISCWDKNDQLICVDTRWHMIKCDGIWSICDGALLSWKVMDIALVYYQTWRYEMYTWWYFIALKGKGYRIGIKMINWFALISVGIWSNVMVRYCVERWWIPHWYIIKRDGMNCIRNGTLLRWKVRDIALV